MQNISEEQYNDIMASIFEEAVETKKIENSTLTEEDIFGINTESDEKTNDSKAILESIFDTTVEEKEEKKDLFESIFDTTVEPKKENKTIYESIFDTQYEPENKKEDDFSIFEDDCFEFLDKEKEDTPEELTEEEKEQRRIEGIKLARQYEEYINSKARPIDRIQFKMDNERKTIKRKKHRIKHALLSVKHVFIDSFQSIEEHLHYAKHFLKHKLNKFINNIKENKEAKRKEQEKYIELSKEIRANRNWDNPSKKRAYVPKHLNVVQKEKTLEHLFEKKSAYVPKHTIEAVQKMENNTVQEQNIIKNQEEIAKLAKRKELDELIQELKEKKRFLEYAKREQENEIFEQMHKRKVIEIKSEEYAKQKVLKIG